MIEGAFVIGFIIGCAVGATITVYSYILTRNNQ
jgi:hypothetical protein